MNGKPSATSTQYDDDTESMVNSKPLAIVQDAQVDPILEAIRQREENCTEYTPQSQSLFEESQQVYTPQRQPLQSSTNNTPTPLNTTNTPTQRQPTTNQSDSTMFSPPPQPSSSQQQKRKKVRYKTLVYNNIHPVCSTLVSCDKQNLWQTVLFHHLKNSQFLFVLFRKMLWDLCL